jgi:N-ethylmaleimide reductase
LSGAVFAGESMSLLPPTKLLSPYDFGELRLRNRMIMAPMTRSRAVEGNVPSPLAPLYYGQRASAGLIVSEGTQVSPQGVGYMSTPGMHTDAQVEGWKAVTKAVHAKGGLIFAQIWHVGRVSVPAFQPDGGLPVSPSAIAHTGAARTATGPVPYGVPRALETEEIAGIVDDFAKAAQRAKDAGFDGVELHGANGYLIDQFLRDGSNQRTDRYGGSIENRARFLIELLEAVTPVWGGGRVGLRLSLTNPGGGMSDSDPVALAGHIATAINRFGLAYLHMIEAVGGPMHNPDAPKLAPVVRNPFHSSLILNGGHTAESAEAALRDGLADAISFGAPFLANPDLPARFAKGAPLNEVDRATMHGGGEHGYTDYPALKG